MLAPLRWLFRLGLVLQIVMLVAFVAVVYLGITFAQVVHASLTDGARPAQAVVVLGAAHYNGDPSPVFKARLDHAADLYLDDIAPVIVVTGGQAEGDAMSEASAGANYLLSEHGITDDDLLRETTSRNSYESLAAAARFLDERGIHDVVLVSDPFHAERIDAIADEVGLDAHVSPTPTSPIGSVGQVRRMGSETVKVALGRLLGFRRMTNLVS